jgi:hypothetical protein
MRFAIVLLPFLLWSAAASADTQWLAFRDPAGVFSTDMPGTPTVAHDSVKGGDGQPVDMLEYTIDRGASAMVVIVSDMTRFTNAVSGTVIDGAVGGVKGMGVQTLSDTISQLDGQAGREIVIVDKDGNRIDDRIFFVGLRLYQVMTVVPTVPTAEQTDDAQHFMNAFHFTGG